jgi:type I restriction-modification system DNA methylase subunit
LIRPNLTQLQFHRVDDNNSFRVIDLACGSGTLLSAVYKEIDAKHRIEAEELKIDEMHRYLIEEGIWVLSSE